MRNFFQITVFILFIIYTPNSYSQEKPVEIKRTEQKIIRDNKIYYVHTVLPGQTLYSISKVYNVTLLDISQSNQGITPEQLKSGQTLYIPEKSTVTLDENYYGLDTKDFIEHKVKSKQTLYFLSTKYNIPVELITKFNPEIVDGLKEGQIVRIPKEKSVFNAVVQGTEDENFYYYIAKPKDTLYSLSIKYGVSVADIILHNPELRWGLKEGQNIKIPRLIPVIDTLQVEKDTIDSVLIERKLSLAECGALINTPVNNTVNVAVLFPFFIESTHMFIDKNPETIIDDKGEAKVVQPKAVLYGERYFNIYQGILLALDSLKKEGLNININIFDTEKDTNKVKLIVGKLKTNMPDIIIGPIFPESTKIVSDFALEHNINVISVLNPFTEQLIDHPNIFQVIPSKQTEMEYLARYVSNYYSDNIILIHCDDSASKSEIEFFKDRLKNSLGDSIFKSISLKEIRYNEKIKKNIENYFSHTTENLLLLFTSNEGYIKDILSYLDYRKVLKTKVIANSSVLEMTNVEIEYFHNMNLIVYTPFYFDYENKHLLYVTNLSRTYLNYEPQGITSRGFNYTLLGYDIGLYFISAVKNFGKDFEKCIEYYQKSFTLGSYIFKEDNPKNGFENKSMMLIQYNQEDYSITKLPNP